MERLDTGGGAATHPVTLGVTLDATARTATEGIESSSRRNKWIPQMGIPCEYTGGDSIDLISTFREARPSAKPCA